jgi:hypothetical protein
MLMSGEGVLSVHRRSDHAKGFQKIDHKYDPPIHHASHLSQYSLVV